MAKCDWWHRWVPAFYCDIKVQLPAEFLPNGVCLSKRGLIELHRLCSEGFSTVKLTISPDETTLLAEAGNYRVYIRLSTIKYPNYRVSYQLQICIH